MNKTKPARRTVWRTLLAMCAGGVVGGVIAYFGLVSAKATGATNLPHPLWFPVFIAISVFLAIVIHECGHLVAALSQGFRFRVLTLGPLAIIDTPAGVRLRWNFRVMALIMGQQISTPPPKTAEHPGATVKNFLVYLLGGGVANLLSAAIAGLILAAMIGGPWTRQLLTIFIIISVALGVINLAPLATSSGIKTDGFHIRALRRGDGGAEYFLALFEYIREVYDGVHPRDWSLESLRCLERHASQDMERAIVFVMRLSHAMAAADHAAAAGAARDLEPVYASIPKALRTQYAAELVYYFSMVEPDAEKATRYAEDARRIGYLGSPATPVRVAACVAFVEGRYDDAVTLCERAIALAPQGLNALDRLMEPGLAQDVIRRARQKTSQPQ
jgi:hypothetical protein